jgi:hypothetical protein
MKTKMAEPVHFGDVSVSRINPVCCCAAQGAKVSTTLAADT